MTRPRTLGAILYEGFELLDLYGPLEMFGILGEELRIVTVADQAGPVASTPGVKTHADVSLAECPDLDLILIPGGLGTFPQLANQALLDFLRSRCPKAELTLSVCSGSALLAKAGLLDGRRATSNKIFFDAITAQGRDVDWIAEARWVEDGPFVTSSGVSAGTDAALAVIERLYGSERAEQIAVFTEYEWHRDASEDPFSKYLNDGQFADLIATAGRST
ncbi:MAG: dimethyladenosine transferase [Deltaproteobacteria bacterium]|nr:dimethyladenosine transferase [Deltaproteobacteria bacterium]